VKSDDPLDRLVSLATAPLGAAPTDALIESADWFNEGLSGLLSRANGFYAFEAALHVFPSGTSEHMSIELWNDPDLWRCSYGKLSEGLVFFAEDIFGGQFVLTTDRIGTFDPETGSVAAIAADVREWAAVLLDDYETLTGYPLAHEWQRQYGALPEGKRLVPKMPFVTGGAFDVVNLYAADAVEGMRARGNLAMQINDLPDGTRIRYRIVE
jgi:hypothetical protein